MPKGPRHRKGGLFYQAYVFLEIQKFESGSTGILRVSKTITTRTSKATQHEGMQGHGRREGGKLRISVAKVCFTVADPCKHSGRPLEGGPEDAVAGGPEVATSAIRDKS